MGEGTSCMVGRGGRSNGQGEAMTATSIIPSVSTIGGKRRILPSARGDGS